MNNNNIDNTGQHIPARFNKRVLILTVGGTIAGKVAASKREGENIKGSNCFTEILHKTCESILSAKHIGVTLGHIAIAEIDSSNVMPEHWEQLANTIRDNYDDYDAFLITHGTNTMGYTASALTFALPNINKPVIITGSQVPAGMPGSDAIMNLENALRLAVLEKDGERIKGVIAVFGSFIITGSRVKKSTEFDYDAFRSFNNAALGRIGRIINLDEPNLQIHNNYLKKNGAPLANDQKQLICCPHFSINIASLTEFPGMDPQILQTLVEINNVEGIILRAFGAGDASERFLDVLRTLKMRQIPVVITTQAPNGNSNFQVNEPGQKIAQENLAIAAHDMSIETQTVKLAWLLYKKKQNEISYNQLVKQMIEDMHGEVQPVWEAVL